MNDRKKIWISHKDMNLTVVCFSGSILYHWATENLMIAEAVYEVHIPSASYNQSLIYLLQFWTCMKCGALLSFLCNDSFRPLID